MLIPRNKNRKIQIGVIGDSVCTPAQANAAYELGRHLAEKGVAVVCGGRTGIMEAVSKGMTEFHGLVIGILPSHDGHDANPYVSIVIPTGMGWTRNSLVAMSSDAVIAIGGKVGTLSEIAFAWMWGKPIVVLGDASVDPESWS
ncbi:MAG TPA: TIGR00725 family protein, partial [Candidatus Hodarchaeales archaeon]|nr:TIGR00725 family protein [Candidatus Hodarchaeales archaeon]